MIMMSMIMNTDDDDGLQKVPDSTDQGSGPYLTHSRW